MGSSSSCFVAFAFPLPFAASETVAVGFVTAVGFEKALVVGFVAAVLVLVVDGLLGFPFW